MTTARENSFRYLPLVWGFDLDVQRLSGNQILVKGKVPVSDEDFRRGRDLYESYLSSVRLFAQKSNSRGSPHVIFANATSDAALIDFVRLYGPIAPIDAKLLKPDYGKSASLRSIDELRDECRATEEMSSLHRERQVYAAALGLLNELKLGQRKASVAAIRSYISEIVNGVSDWSGQWKRENTWRATNRPYQIAWQFDSARYDRLCELQFSAEWEPDRDDDTYKGASGQSALQMGAFQAGQLVLCEVVNAFPVEVDMYGDHPIESPPIDAVRFGIRHCLYLILRRELLSGGATTICQNDRCNSFFTRERWGQVFCSADCSQKFRQRKYWAEKGSKNRRRRIASERSQQKKGRKKSR